MAKASKQTKKFASSGKLKQTIEKRRKFQQIKKKTEGREATKLRKLRKGKGKHADDGSGEGSDDDEDDDEDEEEKVTASKVVKGKGKEAAAPLKSLSAGAGSDGEDDEDEEISDDESFASLAGSQNGDESDLEGDAAAMAKSLAELEKKDPEFFKYLQENDAGLLDFDAEEVAGPSKAKKGKKGKQVEEEEEEDEDEDMEYDAGSSDDEEEPEFEGAEEKKVEKISVTMHMLRGWQRAMIEQRSLRSLRKTILAFRAAAHMNEEDEEEVETRYKIESPLVFNKLVLTALKFTPVVLAKHLPYKTAASGRFKVQAPPASQPTLPRLALSHFNTIMYLIRSLPADAAPEGEEAGAESLLHTVITESTKMLPWVMEGKKQVKAYLKLMLDLWSSAVDSVRIACFLAVRKVYLAGDDAVRDLCLKNIYSALLPPLRLTSAHTLPSLNLMKNSAADLYQLSPDLSYQHAFGYIRMLAVHLRGVVRGGQGDKEAFRAVYNWQFVHCIDFWSLVLAGACDREKVVENGGLASPLEPLIYPLVQIALGVIRLVPTSRFFPLRFHVLHSLLRLTARTGTYIPLAPYCLEILDSSEFKRSNPKNSKERPLDLEYCIRAPAAYPKTKVYQETLAEELVFILGEFHSLMGRNISFPEMTIPVVAALKRHLKRSGGSKANAQIKVLVEKIEANRVWVEKKRRGVTFAPNDRSEVERFLEDVPVEASPIGMWMRLQRKVRDQKRKDIEMAQREEKAPVEEDDSDDSDVDMDESDDE